jgi:heme a synthase
MRDNRRGRVAPAVGTVRAGPVPSPSVSLPDVSPRAYRRITLAAIVTQATIVVTGAAVRLTGSGLGCSDWPKCEEDRLIAPLEGHALVEFVNRTFSAVVLLSVIAAIIGARQRQPYRSDLVRLSVALLVGVLAQIVLGGIVVRLELAPVSVIGHFLLSVVLIWLAVVLHERAGHDGSPGVAAVPETVRRLATAMVAVAVAVIVSGTVVTATGPHSGDERADRLTWFDITEVVRVHAVSALALLTVTLAALWFLYRSPDRSPASARRRATWVTGALLVQGTIGYMQYFTGVPALLVGLHVAGAVITWIVVLRFYLGLRVRPTVATEGTEAVRRVVHDAARSPATTTTA